MKLVHQHLEGPDESQDNQGSFFQGARCEPSQVYEVMVIVIIRSAAVDTNGHPVTIPAKCYHNET